MSTQKWIRNAYMTGICSYLRATNQSLRGGKKLVKVTGMTTHSSNTPSCDLTSLFQTLH